jgi:hypothetical protein
VEGDAVEPVATEGRFQVVAPDGFEHEPIVFALDALDTPRATLPSELLLLDDGRAAIAFTSACNVPAEEIAFTTSGDRVLVEVRAGGFLVIDCVGEPSDWSIVVDPPVDLDGKQVFAADDLGNRRAATAAEVLSDETLFEDDRDLGGPGAPALVLGAIERPTFPSAFSPAPACSNIVYVGRVATSAGTFLEVRDVGSPGADCVLQPGWVSLQPYVSAPDAAPLAVPDVVGSSEAHAVAQLEGLGLDVEVVVEKGVYEDARVVAQDPAAATTVAPGSTVVLTVGPG